MAWVLRNQTVAQSQLGLPMNPYRVTYAAAVLLQLLLLRAEALSQSSDGCLGCHSEPSLSKERRGKVVSLFVDQKRFTSSAHAEVECVSCHEGLNGDEIPHARKIKAVDCLNCHDGEEFSRYAQSVHGKAGTCADCHTAHDIRKLSTDSVARKQIAESICGKCHKEIDGHYRKSDHGSALARGVQGAPSCIDCHDEHEMAPPLSGTSQISRKHEASMCLSCHLDNPDVRNRMVPSTGFISSYENSVHGQAMKNGNEAAATCSDCHGSHEMKKGSNPDSKVAKKNIAATCGRCHTDIKDQYDGSIHGKALVNGVLASATCTDCHGEHNILSPQDPRSPTATVNISSKVCSPCHASVKLTEKYGLAGDRFQSFEDSYHGLAGRGGNIEVANCASCHGIHDIKPSTDSTSRIHPRNLAATCGSCHPGANENFTKGSVHVITTTAGKDEILSLVSTGYVILIVVTIGGMMVHNLLDFVRKSRRKLLQRRGFVPRHMPGHRLYLRMSLGERIQHGLLVVSFSILVLTGFALRFPDAWWVAPVREISPMVFELRSIFHRIAGVVMVLASLYHVYYIFFVPRGKQLLRDLLPVWTDISDAINVMKYNLHISHTKPAFGRFSYIEKSEYWALVWGTIVMAATGLILWFDNTFLGLVGKLWWDVSRTVHYYEAWLATLAIIVWHFYFVIFNPDTYPINLAFWKGTLTEEEMEEEHALELQSLKQRERLQGESDQKGENAHPDRESGEGA